VANLTVLLQRLTKGLTAHALSGLPDRELLQRFTARHEGTAFEAIVRRHGPMVLRACWRVLRQTQDAEDAFQATFLLLAHIAGSVRKPDSLASWLHGVAHRIALKARTQRALRRHHETLHAATAGLPADKREEELRSVLDDEVTRLPEEWRLPLILCYFEGRTQDEAAAQLGWSTRTFRRRLEEARDELGRRLVRRGVALSAALSVLLLSDSAVSAAVPRNLAASTVEAGARVAAGMSAAGVVSAEVLVLTEGVRTAMFVSKLKVMAGVLLLAGAVAAGAWNFLAESRAAQPPGAKPAVKPKSAAANGPNTETGPRVVKADEIVKDGKIVKSLAYCNGGKTLAAVVWRQHPSRAPGGQVSAVVLWDLQKGKVEQTLERFGNGESLFYDVKASKDGTRIAASAYVQGGKVGDTEIKVWEAKTGKLVQTVQTDGAIQAVALSPDGKRVTCPRRGQLFVWDVDTGKPLKTLETPEGHVYYSIAFSEDGKLVAAGGAQFEGNKKGPKAVIWDTETGKVKHELEDGTMTGIVGALAFSPDHKTLATGSGGDATIRIWDVETGKVKHLLNAHVPVGLAFSWDGRTLVSAGTDWKVIVWDVASEKPRVALEGHSKDDKVVLIQTLSVAPDGRTAVSGSADGTMRFWPVVSAEQPEK
jgi:RNA polymerase sigma factor (sigma-70 family)